VQAALPVKENDTAKLNRELAVLGFSCITFDNAKDLRYPDTRAPSGKRAPSFVQRTIPYIVRVVSTRAVGTPFGGTGTVMQYRCPPGSPGLYVSDEWYLVTCAHVVCEDGTATLAPSCYVLFFDEVGSPPIRVDVDVSSARVLSPEPTSDDRRPRSPDELDIAVVRWELPP
jgi:hypothetical protein